MFGIRGSWLGGRQHLGFIDAHRGTDREVVAGGRLGVLDEVFVERVGHQRGLLGLGQHLGGGRRRSDAEHSAPVATQLGGGRSECGGLAFPRRADDKHNVRRTSDRRRPFGLGGFMSSPLRVTAAGSSMPS